MGVGTATPTTQSIATTVKIVMVVADDYVELVKNGMQEVYLEEVCSSGGNFTVMILSKVSSVMAPMFSTTSITV